MIAGLGSIGRRHLRNLLALGEQEVLLYRTHHSTMPDKELEGLPVSTDLDAALAWGPDAVIISNPTAKHLEVAIPAAKAGCHLMLEKPISHSMEGVQELTNIMKETGKQTLVGFQFRFHPVLMQIKSLIDSGSLGKPLSVRAHWGEYLPGMHPWEDYRTGYAARNDLGGGVVLTLCHPFDYLRWLLGEVTGLSAATARTSDLELGVEDQAEVTLHFANGCLGTVHLDYFQRPPAHWLEIIMTDGVIRWDNATGNAAVTVAHSLKIENLTVPPAFERNHLFVSEMKHFQALVSGEESNSRCSLADGVQALRIALGVYNSSLYNSEKLKLE